MEPLVTLHHFTGPLHVESRGGLIAPDFPAIFARYVTEVAHQLGSQRIFNQIHWLSNNLEFLHR